MGLAIAGGISALGGLYSAYNSSKKPTALQPNTYNNYGQVNTPNTGAITSMQSLFNQLNGGKFQSQVQGNTDAYTSALKNAATSPGLSAAYNYALGGVQGKNLSSPLVNKYADQAFNSQISAGADQTARTRAQMARGGVGFSTGNQQAADADMAAAASKGALARSGILSQNEQYERGLQQQNVGQLQQAVGMPASYLSQLNNALYSPIQTQAGITTGLLGGGTQVQQPTYMANPSGGQQLAGGISTANGLFDAYNNFMKQYNAGKQPPAPNDPGDGSDD